MSEHEDLVANTEDLEGLYRALVREQAIREVMAETGESRQIVTEMADAVASMGEEAVTDLFEGHPTTLAAGLRRLVEDWDQNGVPETTHEAMYELTALLGYPWSGEEAMIQLHDVNASLELTTDYVARGPGYLSIKLGGVEVAEIDLGREPSIIADRVAEAVHRAVLARVIADREHIIQLSSTDRRAMLAWLERPSGAWRPDGGGRVSLNAVEGGGVLVRTRPYVYQMASRTQL